MFYRLCLDVTTEGVVRSCFWERHPDDTGPDTAHLVYPAGYRPIGGLANEVHRTWDDVCLVEGLLPFS